MTLEELKKLYGEKGATQRQEYETEGGTQYVDEPVQLGDGWTAWEKQPQIIGFEGDNEIREEIDPADKLGGFQRSEGGKNYYYDTTGKLVHVEKESSFWDDFGPMIMTAATMGGGAGLLGSTLFPSLTAAQAAGAGGALLGGANAAFTDQDILKGALLGGAASAGGMELGDTGFKVADAAKAYNFAQNPTLAGAANLASPYVGSVDLGDTGVSLNDVMKGVGTVQALGSGNDKQVFDAITGLAKTYGSSAGASSGVDQATVGNFDDNEVTRLKNLGYNNDQIKAYFGRLENLTGIFDEEDEGIPVNLGSKSLSSVDQTASNVVGADDTVNVTGNRSNDALNELVITGNKNGASLNDFLSLNNPAGDITNNYTDDLSELVITGNKNGMSLSDFITLNDVAGDTSDNYADDTVFVTGKKDDDYVSNLRTKDIKSDITEITADDIDKLFPDIDFNDILQTVVADSTKTVTPGGTKTVIPAKTVTPGTNTTQQALSNLGLNAPMPSQDPYANIKLMEELFGGDTAYKLRSLGAPKNLASADIDALARMLRG